MEDDDQKKYKTVGKRDLTANLYIQKYLCNKIRYSNVLQSIGKYRS
jgi:hypothetical protein